MDLGAWIRTVVRSNAWHISASSPRGARNCEIAPCVPRVRPSHTRWLASANRSALCGWCGLRWGACGVCCTRSPAPAARPMARHHVARRRLLRRDGSGPSISLRYVAHPLLRWSRCTRKWALNRPTSKLSPIAQKSKNSYFPLFSRAETIFSVHLTRNVFGTPKIGVFS